LDLAKQQNNIDLKQEDGS